MEPVAYKFYRIVLIVDYAITCLAELKLFSEFDQQGVDILQTPSTVLTASTSDPSRPVENLIDGNPSSEWWSTSNPPSEYDWIQCELESPSVIKSIYISRNTSGSGTPRSFEVYGSHDGIEWSLLTTKTGVGPPLDYQGDLNIFIGGVSKLTSGARSNMVRLSNFETGDLIANVLPNEDGRWFYYPDGYDIPFLITHLGPPGYRPISDGPVYGSVLT